MSECVNKRSSRVFSSPLTLYKCIYATLCCVYMVARVGLDFGTGKWVVMNLAVFFIFPLAFLPFIMIMIGGWIAYFGVRKSEVLRLGIGFDIFGRGIGCAMMGYLVLIVTIPAFRAPFFLPFSLLGVLIIVYNITVCVLNNRLHSISSGWDNISVPRLGVIIARISAILAVLVFLCIAVWAGWSATFSLTTVCFDIMSCFAVLQMCGMDPFTPFLLGRYRKAFDAA